MTARCYRISIIINIIIIILKYPR